MLTKTDLESYFTKESQTTIKVMRAFPADQKDFKPHEKSQEAIRLMSTFVFEMYLLSTYLFGDELDRARFQTYQPESVEAVIGDFEKETAGVLSRLMTLPDSGLEKTVEFAGTKFMADEFAMMMLHDQIHHRGQLTVYVRMAGGKVPSIYGPSADDESTNL